LGHQDGSEPMLPVVPPLSHIILLSGEVEGTTEFDFHHCWGRHWSAN